MQQANTQSGEVEVPSPVDHPDLIPCYDPANFEPLGTVAVDHPDAVRAAIVRAKAAQQAWGRATFSERNEVLQRILDHVVEHMDELCEVITRDCGKTREHAMLAEVWPVCEKIRHTMATAETYLSPERVSSGLLVQKKATIHYEPLGVVGIISPWNYPLQNILGPTIPALAAGNAVIVKPSEWIAWSSSRFQQIFDEALEGSGFSTDLVQIVNGYAETGAALVSGGVDKVIFTGSMANGKKVLAESAKTLTPVILELGGKDALVVCDKANLDKAVHGSLIGAFINCGQNCMAAERVIVFDAVYDEFVRRVSELVPQLTQGASGGADAEVCYDLGAMTSPLQVEIVEQLVNDAVAAGARVLAGGKRSDLPGQFFEPTVLIDVTPDMEIMQEETFGPVMCIARVRDETHAIQVTESTQYGLALSIITEDAKQARRIASSVKVGNVSINDFAMTYMANELPFGGVKGSGFGRLNGREGLRACSHVKSVLEDRFKIPAATKLFPTSIGDYAQTAATIRTVYGRGVQRKLAGVTELVKTSIASLRRQ